MNLFRCFADRVSPEYIPKVGMTGTARSMRIILAVQLHGCIGTGRLIPNSRLSPVTHIGQTIQIGASGPQTPQARQLGELAMEILLIAATGIFAIGIVVGIIMVVSHGIRQEERRFQEWRRFQEEHGIWDSPDAPTHFLAEEVSDRFSLAARRLNGLYVRHVPAFS